MEKLNLKFYSRDTLVVARDLLGKYLVRVTPEGKTVGKIIETEAYCGVDDQACHVFGGRITSRNRVLFKEPGRIYVYSIYGMYYCFNVVAHGNDKAGGVFIRALEPVEGIKLMAERRNIKKLTKKNIVRLTDGPSKLCIAMAIDKSLYGTSLLGKKCYILNGKKIPKVNIISTPRINIDYAGKAKKYPWRFLVK